MLGGYYLGQLYLGESGAVHTDTLSVGDTFHGHTVDQATIIEHKTLVVADATHGHTVDNISLIEHKTVIANDTFHNHTVDT